MNIQHEPKEQHAVLIFMLIKNREQIVLCIMQHTSRIISCTTGNQLGQNPTGTCFLFFFLHLKWEECRLFTVWMRIKEAMHGVFVEWILTWPPGTTDYHFYKKMLTLCAAVTQLRRGLLTTSSTKTSITNLSLLYYSYTSTYQLLSSKLKDKIQHRLKNWPIRAFLNLTPLLWKYKNTPTTPGFNQQGFWRSQGIHIRCFVRFLQLYIF